MNHPKTLLADINPPQSPLSVFLQSLLPLRLVPLPLLLLLLVVGGITSGQADGHSAPITENSRVMSDRRPLDLQALVRLLANLPHHTFTLVLLPDLLGVPVEGRGQPLVHV